MMMLCGSVGSISPCTLPRMSSNGPAVPTACPLFIGSRDVISRRTTCACAAVALHASRQATSSDLTPVGLIRYLRGEQQCAQRLAMCVERQGSGHAAAECAGDHEVQGTELRQLVACDVAVRDPGKQRLDALRRDVRAEPRIVTRVEGDQRNIAGVPLVAGTRVRDLAKQAHSVS